MKRHSNHLPNQIEKMSIEPHQRNHYTRTENAGKGEIQIPTENATEQIQSHTEKVTGEVQIHIKNTAEIDETQTQTENAAH